MHKRRTLFRTIASGELFVVLFLGVRSFWSFCLTMRSSFFFGDSDRAFCVLICGKVGSCHVGSDLEVWENLLRLRQCCLILRVRFCV